MSLATDMSLPQNFSYPTGVYVDLVPADWEAAASELEAVRGRMPRRSGSWAEEHKWLLPLFAVTSRFPGHLTGLIDVGCGSGVPLWWGHARSWAPLWAMDLGLLQPDNFPPDTRLTTCNIMSLPELRSAIPADAIAWGGSIIMTEVLEHLEWKPLPMLCVLVERLRPKCVYMTAPTHYCDKFRRGDWVHYSELPTYRGQPIRSAPWHYKGWTVAELQDLVAELGMEELGSFCGIERAGIFAVRTRTVA